MPSDKELAREHLSDYGVSDLVPSRSDPEADLQALFAKARAEGYAAGQAERVASIMHNPDMDSGSLAAMLRRDGYEKGYAAGIEAAYTVAWTAYDSWDKNCNRPQSEHSGPSYAAAVGGAAASRDIAKAIRALAKEAADGS